MDLVVTGGIATGKSTWNAAFRRMAPRTGFFDCDKVVHDLLTEPKILESLRNLFGERVFDSEGNSLDRSALRQLVFRDDTSRRDLEGVLHPAVRTRFEEERRSYFSATPQGIFVADVPLFYETKATYPHDLVVVVATTPETQLRRVMVRRPDLGEQEALSIIHAQKPIMQKTLLADVVAWNEGPQQRLVDQVTLWRYLPGGAAPPEGWNTVGFDDSASIQDRMTCGDPEEVFEALDQRMIEQCVGGLLPGLDERERSVIDARFGLSGGEPQSLRAIGRSLGVSGERVRQIEKNALKALREAPKAHSLALELGLR